ncbi:MAG: UDP-N-acetylglucosamine 1-carboxyvinyltransferase [Ruminococcus sp.]|nr:UDP-N-acetylglucosamine 1-carboxyvinyltransferase [Ruminococcus sp.]
MAVKLIVNGRKKLSGQVDIQGAKNSALPILSATLLTGGENILHCCPHISDINAAIRILRYLGSSAYMEGHTAVVRCDNIVHSEIPENLMREMRSSIVFLGAIIARTGRARLYFPGGCELGPRPIDLHLNALRKMGVAIDERHGCISCKVCDRLHGARISLPFPSVGATENIILAAVLAKGTTVISNAAREPEISDLCEYLNKCGARIYGAGESKIVIDGVEELNGCVHTIIPDRIVAATLMAAAAVTGSEITLNGVISSHIDSIIPMFEESGCKIFIDNGKLHMTCPDNLSSFKSVRTMPYPGFPTDAQAVMMAVACVAKGTTVFVENIFESRYRHVEELTRLGANIKVANKVAVVEGVNHLFGAKVTARELRGAASLVVTGLCAEGVTEIEGINFLERGYENLEVTLSELGADIKKV